MATPKNYFTLTREGSGLTLKAYSSGVYLGSLSVRSGFGANAKNFRTRANERRGQLEPVPEGVYTLGVLEWKGGPGNYAAKYPLIDSPIWVTIIGHPRYIGLHLDSGAEGTAGCVGFKTMADLKTFVNWVNGYGYFSRMYVDWGLGSVKLPVLESKPKASPSVTVAFKNKEISNITKNGGILLTAQDLRDLGIGVAWDEITKTATILV